MTLVVAASMVAAVSACSSGKSAGAASSGSSGGTALQAATVATAKAQAGTSRQVDPTPRPAVAGKHIVVISAGQASISSQIPVDAAAAAAKTLGWTVDVYDAKLNPANFSPLIRQAIGANADGIILDAIDCQDATAALQEAKAKHIVLVPIYAIDCTDPLGGAAAQGVFSANIDYGTDIATFFTDYGAAQAQYIIAESHNTAKIITVQDDQLTILRYIYKGFNDTIAASGGSKIVDELKFTDADLGTGKLAPSVQAEVLRHPEATWLKSGFTAATTLGVAPGLGANTTHLKVMGGEGYSPELDLMRQGKVAAANIISSEWVGWAAADTMNSVFAGTKPVDSGLGWTMSDPTHNMPASGEFVGPIDFKAEYKKAWGVS